MNTITESYLSWITYEQYCNAIDTTMLHEGAFNDLKGKMSPVFFRAFRETKGTLDKIGKDFKIGGSDLLAAIKQKDFFKIFKAFGFNIKLMLKSMNSLSELIRKGLMSVFAKLAKTKTIQKIRKGLIKVDDLVQQHPILATVTGVGVAGLLLYIWLNMTFIGNLDYDFDFSDMASALKGDFSLADLFTSDSGLMMVALFGSGAMFGLSVPWLGKTAYNLITAIFYTLFKKKKHKTLVTKLKKYIKLERYR